MKVITAHKNDGDAFWRFAAYAVGVFRICHAGRCRNNE